jgi:hypothetical protein
MMDESTVRLIPCPCEVLLFDLSSVYKALLYRLLLILEHKKRYLLACLSFMKAVSFFLSR